MIIGIPSIWSHRPSRLRKLNPSKIEHKISRSEGAALCLGISQGRSKQSVITWKTNFLLARNMQCSALVREIMRFPLKAFEKRLWKIFGHWKKVLSQVSRVLDGGFPHSERGRKLLPAVVCWFGVFCFFVFFFMQMLEFSQNLEY